MSVVLFTGALKWVRAAFLLTIVWLAVPSATLWSQPWILWTALWFLSTRTSFWVQVTALLLLGLQFDVLQDWSLGLGVILVAFLSGVMSLTGLRSQQFRFFLLLIGGILFCLGWSLWQSSLSNAEFAIQVAGVLLLAFGEVWNDRRK